MFAKIFFRFRNSVWIAYLLALSGGVVYFYQAWIYAHIQTSFLDEGGYLYIGNLFARGIIRPFQDYGVARLYAPLSYLIPGQIEFWFGAGLRTGRYFSIFCTLIMMTALWLTTRRLGGNWWATAVVWALAFTPISIQIYSLAISQALTACLLVCSLSFVLGDNRPTWHIFIGSVLAGLTVMTRQNLVPLVPFLVAYVFWQHGKKKGWISLAASFLPIILIHILFWPNILELWAVRLPSSLTPFLDPFRFPAGSVLNGTGVNLWGKLSNLFQGLRFHYFTTVGFFVCLFLWPGKNDWKNETQRKAAYFLTSLFLVLALLHIAATFSATNSSIGCTYCLTPYLAFFDVIVFLLIVVSVPSWKKKISGIRGAVIVISVLILSAGLGYANFETLGYWLLKVKFPAITRSLDPHHWTPFISLWDILSNRFHLEFWSTRVPVSVVGGLLLGILGLILGFFIYRSSLKTRNMSSYSFSSFFIVMLVGFGFILSPLMGGIYRQDGICHADILKNYEQIGKTIREIIPEKSRVYVGGNSAVPFLYVPDIYLYYPQIYNYYDYRRGGNMDELLKHGFWNEILASDWLSKADYLVLTVNQQFKPDSLKYTIYQTAPTNPCDSTSYLSVYVRIP